MDLIEKLLTKTDTSMNKDMDIFNTQFWLLLFLHYAILTRLAKRRKILMVWII